MSDYDDIRYVGPPTMTNSGREVLEFHFHRFLAPWLQVNDADELSVAVGFEASNAPSQTFEVNASGTKAVETAWTFEDALQTWRHGDGLLRLSGDNDEGPLLRVVPLLDHEFGNREHAVVIGFALLEDDVASHVDLDELQAHAAEAIRAARRNAVRLYFDEGTHNEIKGVLYGMLEHMPEWTACDGSASIILSNSLDALTLDASGSADFHVMAERLFHGGEDVDRLVGMWLSADESSFLGAAVRSQKRSGNRAVHKFSRNEDDDTWTHLDASYGAFHIAERDEHVVILVPLLLEDEVDSELIGFLSLAYRQNRTISAATVNTLTVLSERLATHLRHSAIYTLSARKMWMIDQIRSRCEQAIAMPGDNAVKRSALLHEVCEIVQNYADVPAFSVGYITDTDPKLLRYETSFGWTDFVAIDLELEPPSSRDDSGVSALAARINRTLVLAGRQQGEEDTFKNYLFVNEETGDLVDARTPGGERVLGKGGTWTKLAEYYKPARDSAYATLAVPITFADEVLGIVAVEVDRDTHWYWWTGYGGQLLWKSISHDLAYALRSLS